MTFSSIGYIINYSTGIIIIDATTEQRFFIVGIGSTINGICSAYLFVCVGRYIHKVCSQHN